MHYLQRGSALNRGLLLVLICAAFVLLVQSAARAERQARLISFPALSSDGATIYFSCWGDIWSAPRDGSAPARRLTDNVAFEGRPLPSPDGTAIAFVSDRFGSYDVFVMPTAGGEPVRLTWHSTTDYVYDWKPDGTALLGYLTDQDLWANALYEIPLDGSQPIRLSGPDHDDNVFGSYTSSTGEIAYSRGPGDWTRQNYRGSTAYDIWLYDTAARRHTPLVEGDTNDLWPQPSTDGSVIYFASQRSGKDNLWAVDRSTRALRQLTDFTDVGISWPRISNDGDEIAFERLGQFWVYSVATGAVAQVPIRFADDPKHETELNTTLPNNVSEFKLSPNGNYFATVVFGDIYILKNPEKYKEDEKPDQDLSRTHHIVQGSGRDFQVSWHPDSTMITYISDRRGQYDVYTFDLITGTEYRITETPQEEWMPAFDPTGKHLAYYSGNRQLKLYNLEAATESVLAEGTLKLGPWQLGFEWSPDGQWISYGAATYGWIANVLIVNIGEKQPKDISVTPDWAYGGRWSPDGKYLTYTLEREEGTQVMLVELDPEANKFDTDLLFPEDEPQPEGEPKKDEAAPATPQTPAEETADAAPDEAAGEPAGDEAEPEEKKEEEEIKPVSIDFDDIHLRGEPLAPLSGNTVNPVWSPDSKFVVVTNMAAENILYAVTVEEREVTQLGPASEEGNQQFTPDAARLYFQAGDSIQYLELRGTQASGGGMQPVTSKVALDQYTIWEQVLTDGWRQLRDGLYDPEMHGVDWQAVLERYLPLVREAGVADDFGTIYRRMLGELGASHLGYYNYGSEVEAPAEITADFGVVYDEGYSGAGWLVDRVLKDGPADQKGSELYAGDVILSVNGIAVDHRTNRGRVLRNLSGEPVILQVRSGADYPAKGNEGPQVDQAVPGEREVVIQPVPWFAVQQLHYEEWVRDNRTIVETASGGQIAYQHIQGMNTPSLERFRRELFTESRGKKALIIDVRFNGGGNTHEELVDLIDRRPFTIEQHRDAPANEGPLLRWVGPVVVLINAHSYSDAEIFPIIMQELGLATVIGETTGGNVIGTYDFPLMDGSMLRMPAWGWYTLSGVNMEGTGARPDIYVHIDPNTLREGHDNQLEAAIGHLLGELGGSAPAQ